MEGTLLKSVQWEIGLVNIKRHALTELEETLGALKLNSSNIVFQFVLKPNLS